MILIGELKLEIHPQDSTSCSFFDLWNRVAEFLTKASRFHENVKWQELMNKLESADPSSPDWLG